MRRYTPNDDARFTECLEGLTAHPAIQRLKGFPQHRTGTTYGHCVNVAGAAYRLARRLHVEVDIPSLVRAAMLHDYFLNSTKTMPYSEYRHGGAAPARRG